MPFLTLSVSPLVGPRCVSGAGFVAAMVGALGICAMACSSGTARAHGDVDARVGSDASADLEADTQHGADAGSDAVVEDSGALDTATAPDASADVSLPPFRGEVWLAPNIGSPDLLDLFSRPDDWALARSRVAVFQLYHQEVLFTDPSQCPSCGPNLLPALVERNAFATLSSWGIGLAIEAGAVKDWGCTADVTAPGVQTAIDSVIAAGGVVRYIAMDEPLIGGQATWDGRSCGYSVEEAAQQVVAFVDLLAASHPEVRVGDIEPYPYYSAFDLELWLAALVGRGYRPAFFHLDVDLNHVRSIGADVEGDLAELAQFCASQDIPFGVIYTAHEINSPSDPALLDRFFYDRVMGWIPRVQRAIGAPDHSIFQSWFSSPFGNIVPTNLPENAPDAYTMTRLVNDGLALWSD